MDALENHPSKIKKMRYKLIKPIQPKRNQVRVPHPHPPIQPQSKKKSLYSSMNIKDMNKTMFGYFTELTTFLRDTTGLVVSYVKGLLFGDPFITETPVHIQEDNETPVHIQPIVTVTETTSALDGAVRSYVVEVDRPTDPITFMRLVKPKVLGEIFRRETKVYMGLECAMEKIGVGDEAEDTDVSHFRTKCERLLDESEYEEFYDGMVDTILLHFAEYQKRGSGWRLDHIRHLNVKVSLNSR